MERVIEYDKKIEIHLSEENIHYTNEGAVYKGYESDGRIIACKLVNATEDYKQTLACVKQEAAVLRRLEKEYINVPRIYGIKECKEKGQVCLFLEWIEGLTLAEEMKGGMTLIRFLRCMEQLSEILMVLERNKITHKDIKPENIIINKNSITSIEKVYLIDFDISLNLSMRGEGTKDYRAPEMWNNSSDVHRERADLFSVGVIMYEYFTGGVPSRGVEYKSNPLGGKEWKTFVPPKEKNNTIGEDINNLIIKLMKYDAKDRVKDAGELRRAIQNIIRQEKRRK